jgi:hypothetical protein
MELCFKNGVGDYNEEQLSEMIKLFVSNDEATVSKLKFSSMSPERILGTVIEAVCEPGSLRAPRDEPDTAPHAIPFKMIAAIEPDMYIIPFQLFHAYPSLIRQDIPFTDQLNMLSSASEDMSFADILRDGFYKVSPEIMTEDNEDDEVGSRPSDIYLTIGVLSPLFKLKRSISKSYKLNATGYAKMYGVKSSIDGQLRIPKRCGELSPFLYDRSLEYLRYFSSKLAILMKQKEYDTLIQFFNDNRILDPVALIEELIKLKILDVEGCDEQTFGTNLVDVWKTTVKRDFSKEFGKRKPKTQGVKFIEPGENQPEKKKIRFFENYLSGTPKK